MNCRPERCEFHLKRRFELHQQVASMGINLSDRIRARKNFLRLVELHREFAAMYGFGQDEIGTLERVYRGPLAPQA